MAALTEDRFGQLKVKRDTIFSHFKLDDSSTEIFSHSLVVLGSNDGLEPATASSSAPVLYAQKRAKDGEQTLQYDSHGENGQAEALSGVIALLNATGLSASDVNKKVYADDDNTVSTAEDGVGEENVEMVDGDSVDTNIPVTDIETDDTLISVFEEDASSGVQTDVTSEASITSSGNIQLDTTDTTGNKLIVTWRNEESRPYVGRIVEFVSATEAYVRIPGLLNA